MDNPTRENFHQKAHFFCLVLMATGLPLSMFLMSISGILMFLNWLAWGNPLNRVRLFLRNRTAVVFSLLYLIHLLSLLYTADLEFGLRDLRIKLPLLLFPVVLSSVPPLDRKKWYLLLAVFTGAVFLGTFCGFAVFAGWTGRTLEDFRSLSPFISHIRFSLLICLVVVLLAGAIIIRKDFITRLLLWSGICWLIFFLNLMQSATGFVILFVLLLVFALRELRRLKNTLLRISIIACLLLAPLGYVAFEAYAYFFLRDQYTSETVPQYSVNGEPYIYDWDHYVTENGHYVLHFLAEHEFEREWSKRSRLNLDSVDEHGFQIRGRVYRYMASLNLRKDSVGLWELSASDIAAIENGATNVNAGDIPPIKRRLQATFLEIDQFRSGVVNGASLIQRMFYLRTGWQIFLDHPFTGVGVGDTQLAFHKKYNRMGSELLPEFRLRAHNQYLTMLLTFGIVGFLVFLGAVLYPVWVTSAWKSNFFKAFMIVAGLSFLTEDTLETQAGVSFFIFFYALGVWGVSREE